MANKKISEFTTGTPAAGDYIPFVDIAGNETKKATKTDLTGAQGAQGYQGTTGSQGPQGYQGPQGTVGGSGSQGSQGFQGPQGTTGPQGSTTAITIAKGGSTTHALNTAGAQNIAHGLGKTPKSVSLFFTSTVSGGTHSDIFGDGFYDGTTQGCVYEILKRTAWDVPKHAQNTNCIIGAVDYDADVSSYRTQATASVDATNIVLTWSITDTGYAPSGNCLISWLANG
jgi:hypothetical protein